VFTSVLKLDALLVDEIRSSLVGMTDHKGLSKILTSVIKPIEDSNHGRDFIKHLEV
jgi:hypothetical protein